MKYTIEVTDEDIRRAYELVDARDRGEHLPLGQHCPIALGAMRALHAERVETLAAFVPVGEPYGWTLEVSSPVTEGARATRTRVFTLPRAAVEFIQRFDGGRDVRPFSFEVEG